MMRPRRTARGPTAPAAARATAAVGIAGVAFARVAFARGACRRRRDRPAGALGRSLGRPAAFDELRFVVKSQDQK